MGKIRSIKGAYVEHPTHGLGIIMNVKKKINRVVVHYVSQDKPCEYAYPDAIGKFFFIVDDPESVLKKMRNK